MSTMKNNKLPAVHPHPSRRQAMPALVLPPQLRSIIHKEQASLHHQRRHPTSAPSASSSSSTGERTLTARGGHHHHHLSIVRDIEQAKQNELAAYLTLCRTRLQIPSSSPTTDAPMNHCAPPMEAETTAPMASSSSAEKAVAGAATRTVTTTDHPTAEEQRARTIMMEEEEGVRQASHHGARADGTIKQPSPSAST